MSWLVLMSLFLKLQQTYLLAQVYAKLCHLSFNTIALIWPIKSRQNRLWWRIKVRSGESSMRFFPLSPSKQNQRDRNGKKFLYKLYLYWKPSSGVQGWPAGLGKLVSQLLADDQVPLCSVGHNVPKLALLMCPRFRLQPLGWCTDLSSHLFKKDRHMDMITGMDLPAPFWKTELESEIRILFHLAAM